MDMLPITNLLDFHLKLEYNLYPPSTSLISSYFLFLLLSHLSLFPSLTHSPLFISLSSSTSLPPSLSAELKKLRSTLPGGSVHKELARTHQYTLQLERQLRHYLAKEAGTQSAAH